MAIRPIEILNTLINSTAHTITITSVNSLGSGAYKLNTANTLYLRTGKTVTIDAVDYYVTDFSLNSYITVSAVDGSDVPVVATSFTIQPALFKYGSPKLVSNELNLIAANRYDSGTQVWPFIWLVEISNTAGTMDPAAAIKSTPSINMFFLDSNKFDDWTIEDHYELDVYPQLNYIDFFLAILKSRRDLFETDQINYSTTNWINFGDYIVDQGNNERILNDNVTGVQLQLSLPIVNLSCLDIDASPTCAGVTIFEDGSFLETVPSGGRFSYSTAGDTAGNTMNGTSLTDIVSGTTKAFTIRYADDSPVTVTTITDNATTFIGEVPNATSDIAYIRNGWHVKRESNLTHDLGWYLTNTSYFSYNVNGLTPILDPTDDTKLLTNNAFGNLNRVTNSLGLTATYDGSNGEISDYAIDHYTGYGWYLQDAVGSNTSWSSSASTIEGGTFATFSDWRMPTVVDVNNICTQEASNSNILYSIHSWSGDIFWLLNSDAATTIFFWRQNINFTGTTRIGSFSNSTGNANIRAIAVRNHY